MALIAFKVPLTVWLTLSLLQQRQPELVSSQKKVKTKRLAITANLHQIM